MCDGCGCGANLDVVVLKVDGMTCGHCKKAVEKALLKLNGIVSAEVDLDDKSVTVNFVGDATNVEKMEAAIVDAGYSVVK